MSDHISETALEHYLLGANTLDTATLETHILECETCAARVRDELALESALGQVAAAARFCPGCGRVLGGDRCDQCGATTMAGGYRIERVLVKTTHGRLYAAVDGHGNRVALKELAFVQAPTLETLAAFDRETKFLRALSHPCIPKFHASFIEGTGIHTRMYIAQDLVEGESLLARMQTHWFDEREIVRIARAVLEILIYLQSLSPMVFHRDIKPANLIARGDGSFALVDFGAARDVSDTMGNTAVGTFGYMPMEQMAGIYDATTDLYALGASLLHLLTRREPWKLLDGGGSGVNISPELRRYLDKLMARRPEDRFPDARAALEALLARRPPTTPRRKKALLLAGVVALCGGGGALGAVLALGGSDDGDEVARALAKMEQFTGQMCQCRDKQCADGVNQAFTAWGTRYAETLKRDYKPDPEVAKRSAEVMTRYTECMVKVIMPTTPVAVAPDAGVMQAIELEPQQPDRVDPDLPQPVAATDRTRSVWCKLYERLPSGRCPPPRSGTSIALPADLVDDLELYPTASYPVRSRVNDLVRVHDGSEHGILVVRLRPGSSVPVVTNHGTLEGGFYVIPPAAARTFSVAGYEDVVVENATPAGTIEYTVVTLKKVRPPESDGHVSVTSVPKARISIDGVDTGWSTPAKLRLSPGRHKIGFSYGTTKSAFPLIVKSGETINFHKHLE